MLEPILTEKMKKHAIIVLLAEEHSGLDIAAFLKLVRSFIFKIKNELKAARFDVATLSYRKRLYQQYVIIKTPKFVICIDENPKKSMRAVASELQVEEAAIRCVIYDDLRKRVFVISRRQFLSERTRDKRLTKA